MPVIDHGLTIRQEAGFPLTKIKPLFSSRSRCVFVGCGNDVKKFSASSGHLESTLHGHDCQVVSICRDPTNKDGIVSCDISGMVIYWNQNSDKKKVVEIGNNSSVAYFNGVGSSEFVVGIVTVGFKTMQIHYVQRNQKQSVLTNAALIGPNKVSVGLNGQLICALGYDRLFTFFHPFTYGESNRKHIMPQKVTCLECHPHRNLVAVGDDTGCITLLFEVHLKHPIRQKLHWHTLPVADMSFSCTGDELLSGGGECVCVEWRINTRNKKFLPRMGCPIKFVTVDRANDYVIASHLDNSLSLLDAREFLLKGTIQELVTHVNDIGPTLPCGLKFDSVSNCLVLNGRMGHLQFYDFYQKKLLYQLDITMINFTSDEREAAVSNIDVRHVEISKCGWMVTCESCILSDHYTDSKIKFWKYSHLERAWELSTCIVEPHLSEITSICLSPVIMVNGCPLCVSCGSDGIVKQWANLKTGEGQESDDMWLCKSNAEYLDLSPGQCQFSSDGTVVAISFAQYLTLWKSDGMHLMGTLSKTSIIQEIQMLEFIESVNGNSRIIACTSDLLCCWDILSCNLIYVIDISVQCMASDPLSGMVSLFDKTGVIHVVDPCDPQFSVSVNYSKREVGDAGSPGNSRTFLSAAFIPPMSEEDSNADTTWKSNSELCFVDSDQILSTVQHAKAGSMGVPSRSNIHVDKLLGDFHWSGSRSAFSSSITSAYTDQNKTSTTMDQDLADASPESLMKHLLDVHVSHVESFPSLVKMISNVIPNPSKSCSTIANEIIPMNGEDKWNSGMTCTD